MYIVISVMSLLGLLCSLCACAPLQEFESLYEGTDSCKLGHFSKFVNPDLRFCGGPMENTTATLLVQSPQVNMNTWTCLHVVTCQTPSL